MAANAHLTRRVLALNDEFGYARSPMFPKWTDKPSVIAAHEHCNGNRLEVLDSSICGCFYCLHIFPPEEITRWWSQEVDPDFDVPEDWDIAFCPSCGIDSVIGSASGYPITHEFLSAMEKHWFNLL